MTRRRRARPWLCCGGVVRPRKIEATTRSRVAYRVTWVNADPMYIHRVRLILCTRARQRKTERKMATAENAFYRINGGYFNFWVEEQKRIESFHSRQSFTSSARVRVVSCVRFCCTYIVLRPVRPFNHKPLVHLCTADYYVIMTLCCSTVSENLTRVGIMPILRNHN